MGKKPHIKIGTHSSESHVIDVETPFYGRLKTSVTSELVITPNNPFKVDRAPDPNALRMLSPVHGPI